LAQEPSPFVAGLRQRCPHCGQGPVFVSYLRFADQCSVCGADFRIADAGDGPAVFVIFVVGALAVPVALILQFGLNLPGWLVLSISFAFVIALSAALLPPFKATLFALQWRHKAGEGRLDRDA
jgi:uncharacterized protein (DUF983 family)